MSVAALNRPDATDLIGEAIVPQRELESCNHLLGDYEALMRFHDEQGYIFLRNVLDPESVEQARRSMFEFMIRHKLVRPEDIDAEEAIWTGEPFEGGYEESPEFAGIARKLVEHPNNQKVMEQILGEPASIIPIVQYRTYPPGGSITPVHQDGFYSPGIMKYKPVWMPLVTIDREMGGLMVAVGHCNRGFLHNLAKPAPYPLPDDVIPEKDWATATFHPGDVLILNPFAPHGSLPNTSNRIRVSIDTRVQSAADPRVIMGDITALSPNHVEIRTPNGKDCEFKVDDKTFIRIASPGTRESIDHYVENTVLGTRIVVIFEGGHAETLRRASDN